MLVILNHETTIFNCLYTQGHITMNLLLIKLASTKFRTVLRGLRINLKHDHVLFFENGLSREFVFP
jgi:hypothetical protein